MNSGLQQRIISIDILRGIVMVIMALDHVRDFFHIGANLDDPLNLATTTPPLYFTRWITHFCAPIFIFLSGVSIYLQHLKKTNKQLARFVLTRGIWLIFMEMVIISFGWSFNPMYAILPFQVIWVIGMSMVLLGVLIVLRTPHVIILMLGLAIVVFHNLLDIPESASDFKSNFWWDLLHHGGFSPYTLFDNHRVLVIYPVLPWFGLMLVGYSSGIHFAQQFNSQQRQRTFFVIGLSLIFLFVVIRYLNSYGDAKHWSVQKNMLFTLLSFIDTSKYPPSLHYLLMTIGPAFLALALLDKIRLSKNHFLVVFGRTAFLYYILHLYLIHFLALISFFMHGHRISEISNTGNHSPFLFVVSGEGFDLPGVYMIWIVVVATLYPICKKYDRYKSLHKEKWWLSYL